MQIFQLIIFTASCRPRNDRWWQKEGNEECCSDLKGSKCGEGDGDCDKDSECEGSLVCGRNNCPWGDGDDCCMKPPSKNEISLIGCVGPYTFKAITLGVNVTSFHDLPLLAARTSSTKFDA